MKTIIEKICELKGHEPNHLAEHRIEGNILIARGYCDKCGYELIGIGEYYNKGELKGERIIHKYVETGRSKQQ